MSNHPNRGKVYRFIVLARGEGIAKFFEQEPAVNYAQWLADFGGAPTQVIADGMVIAEHNPKLSMRWTHVRGDKNLKPGGVT